MAKHTTQHPTAVRHPRSPARHAAKAIAVKKAPVAEMPAPLTMTVQPPPKFIEVMELEFTDPDILLDEDAVVTGFDEEDF